MGRAGPGEKADHGAAAIAARATAPGDKRRIGAGDTRREQPVARQGHRQASDAAIGRHRVVDAAKADGQRKADPRRREVDGKACRTERTRSDAAAVDRRCGCPPQLVIDRTACRARAERRTPHQMRAGVFRNCRRAVAGNDLGRGSARPARESDDTPGAAIFMIGIGAAALATDAGDLSIGRRAGGGEIAQGIEAGRIAEPGKGDIARRCAGRGGGRRWRRRRNRDRCRNSAHGGGGRRNDRAAKQAGKGRAAGSERADRVGPGDDVGRGAAGCEVEEDAAVRRAATVGRGYLRIGV